MQNEYYVLNFCRNVCYLRRKNSLTQKEMAEILGVSVSSLRKMEKGDVLPKIHCRMLLRVCERFDLPADRLLYILLEDEYE